MKNKAFVSILEIIAVIIILIVAFSIFSPGFFYQNRWEQAFISLKGRDLVLTLDRIGNLYQYSFDERFLRDFLDKMVPTNLTNLIHWSRVQGTIKPKITVACACTKEQRDALINWIGRLKINGRNIDFDIVSSGLDPIYDTSDVLLIWGDQKLDDFKIKTNIQNYARANKGIVEIRDFDGQGDLDDVQKNIFGIDRCDRVFPGKCGIGGTTEISFEPKPDSATRKTYTSFKYFHSIPLPISTTNEVPSFNSGQLSSCTSPPNVINEGVVEIRDVRHKFWICNGETKSVYFDTEGNPDEADIIAVNGDKFTIDNQELLLRYIESNVIGISFESGYMFTNFLDGGTKLYPKDEDQSRILLSKGTYTNTQNPIPASIVNDDVSRVAWVSDFTKDLTKVGDDHKMLLVALMLWTSDKRYVSGLSNLRLGHLTSYVNVNNIDMYEVYRFDLGLGFPF